MENTNQNKAEEVSKESAIVQGNNSKSILGKIIVPLIIVIILGVFAGTIYYAKAIKPKKDINNEAGFNSEEYITLGKYTGLDYEITQQDFDECVKEETNTYDEVKRAAQNTDQIDFDYTGYVDGKKDDNISQKDAEIIIGAEDEAFKAFSEAIVGHKSGEKVTVEMDDATKLSADGSDYSGKKVKFTIKIKAVSELVVDEVTDEWVKDNYSEDEGINTKEEFYEWCKAYLEDNARTELWQKVLDNSKMNGYPQDLYDDVVTEFTQDANYYADMFGTTTEEYLKDFCGYTDATLEEEYLNEVKSELVMWEIIKKEGFTCSDTEIEEKYEEMYEECGYDTVEEMKKDYTKSEIKEAVYLDKAQDHVYSHSNVKESFKMPNK